MMRKLLNQVLFFLLVVFLLPSCQFRCNVGEVNDKKERRVNKPVIKENGSTVIYNGIELETHKIKVRKAYLAFKDGERVPGNNVVDFNKPVNMAIFIDSGWTEHENKVLLGASEKVTTDDGRVLLDEKDLFAKDYRSGISPEDAKNIRITVNLTLESGSGPGFFTVSFTIWDKKSVGYIKGQYRLYTD